MAIRARRLGVPGAVLAGSQVFTRLASFGHSYAGDLGGSSAMHGWANKLARVLRAEHVHYGHQGSAGALDDSNASPNVPGGWSTVLDGLRPQVQQGGGFRLDRTSAPYLPMHDLVAFDFGANDMWAAHTAPASSAAMVRNAVRAMICRARAGGLFEDTHASVVYTGTWTNSAVQGGKASGGSLHSSSHAGDLLTITVPADFPGGEVDLGFLYFSGGQAVWSVTVDAGAAVVFDTSLLPVPTAASKYTHGVLRLQGLAPGAHTIVATLSSVTAGAGWFDYWQVASPTPPAVLVVNQPYLSQSFANWVTSGNAGFQHSPVTSGDFDLLNAQLAAVVAEFDSTVVLVDALTAFGGVAAPASGTPNALQISDGIHPNDRGHTVLAQAALAALGAVPANRAMVPGAPHWRQVGAIGGASLPNGAEPALGTGWSPINVGFSAGKFAKDAMGRVHLRFAVKSAAQPPTVTTIFTLPEGYWPGDLTELPAVSGNGNSVGSLEVDSNGNVIWISGTATSSFVVDQSFLCDE